jgi:hypothetical protein
VHVSDKLEVFLKYVGKGGSYGTGWPRGMQCIREMLDNLHVQQTAVNEQEREVFKEELQTHDLDHTILTVLEAMCTCGEVPIHRNQKQLTEMFKQDNHDSNALFIRFFDQESIASRGDGHVDLTVQIPIQAELDAVPRPQLSPPASREVSPARGQPMLAPLELPPHLSTATRMMSILQMDSDPKRRLFCEGQLKLMASLCKHRNYYAIKFVRQQLSLSVMVDAIRSMAYPVQIIGGTHAGRQAWLSCSAATNRPPPDVSAMSKRRASLGIVDDTKYEVRLEVGSESVWEVVEVSGRDLDPNIGPAQAEHIGDGAEGSTGLASDTNLTLLKPTLSPNLRASFCSLLVHAYLDCNSGTVTLSQNTFVWTKINALAKTPSAHAHNKRRLTSRMAARKTKVTDGRAVLHRDTKPMQLSHRTQSEDMQLYKELQQTIEAHLLGEVEDERGRKAAAEEGLMDTKKAFAAGANSPRGAGAASTDALMEEQDMPMAMTESLMDLMLKLVDAGFYETASHRRMLQDSVDLIFTRLCQMVDIDDADPPQSLFGGAATTHAAKKKKKLKKLKERRKKERAARRKLKEKRKAERTRLGLKSAPKTNVVAPNGRPSELQLEEQKGEVSSSDGSDGWKEDHDGDGDSDGSDGDDDGSEDERPSAPFMDRFKRKNVLRFLDSIPVMFGVIGLVILAIVVGFAAGNDACNTVHDHVHEDDHSHFHKKEDHAHKYEAEHMHKHSTEPLCGFFIFDTLVSFVFACELVLRFYAVWDFMGLFGNPYTMLDIIVVGLDVVALAAGDVLPMDPKILRVLRAVRLLKVYRVYSTLKNLRNQKKVVRLPKYELPDPYRKASYRNTYLKMVEIMAQVTRLNQQAQMERLVAGIKQRIVSHISLSHPIDWDSINWVHVVKEATAEAIVPDEHAGIKYYKLRDQSKEDTLAMHAAALEGIAAGNMESASAGNSQESSLRSALPRLLDLHHSHELHDMVLRLIMHEYTPLVEATLTFLMLHHAQHKQLVSDLQQVQLIMRSQEEHLFEQHRRELSTITKTLESALAIAEADDSQDANSRPEVAPSFKRVVVPIAGALAESPQEAPGISSGQRSSLKRSEEMRDIQNLLRGFSAALKTIDSLTHSMSRLDQSWIFTEPEMVCSPYTPSQVMLRHLGAASFFQRWRSSIDLGLAFANDMHADTLRRVRLVEGEGCPTGLGGRSGELKYPPPVSYEQDKQHAWFLDGETAYEVTGDFGDGLATVHVLGRQLEHESDLPLQLLVSEVKALCGRMYRSLNGILAMFVQRNKQNQSLLGNSDSIKELQQELATDTQSGEQRGAENLLMELLRDNKGAVAILSDEFIDDIVKLIFLRITKTGSVSSKEELATEEEGQQSGGAGGVRPNDHTGHAGWENYSCGNLFQLLCRVCLVADVPKPKAQLMTVRALCQPSPAGLMSRCMILCADPTVDLPEAYANALRVKGSAEVHATGAEGAAGAAGPAGPAGPAGLAGPAGPGDASTAVVDQGMSASEMETPCQLRCIVVAPREGRRMTGPPADDEKIEEAAAEVEAAGELGSDLQDPFMSEESVAADDEVVASALHDLRQCDAGAHQATCVHGETRWKCVNTSHCGVTWHTRRALMRMTARARRKCALLECTFEDRVKESNDWMKAGGDAEGSANRGSLGQESNGDSTELSCNTNSVELSDSAVDSAPRVRKKNTFKTAATKQQFTTRAKRMGDAISSGLNETIVLNRTKQVLRRVKETMPPVLCYILQLLELLCLCCAGGVNMVEARVQRMYPLADMLSVITHRDTIIDMKLVLARLFFEAYIDVEVPVPGFSSDELLEQVQSIQNSL